MCILCLTLICSIILTETYVGEVHEGVKRDRKICDMKCSRSRCEGVHTCSEVSRSVFDASRKLRVWGCEVVRRLEKHQKSLGFRRVNFNRCEKEQVKMLFLSCARRYLRMLGRGSEESRRKKSPEIRAEMFVFPSHENFKMLQACWNAATCTTEDSASFFRNQFLCFGNTVAGFTHFVLL